MKPHKQILVFSSDEVLAGEAAFILRVRILWADVTPIHDVATLDAVLGAGGIECVLLVRAGDNATDMHAASLVEHAWRTETGWRVPLVEVRPPDMLAIDLHAVAVVQAGGWADLIERTRIVCARKRGPLGRKAQNEDIRKAA